MHGVLVQYVIREKGGAFVCSLNMEYFSISEVMGVAQGELLSDVRYSCWHV